MPFFVELDETIVLGYLQGEDRDFSDHDFDVVMSFLNGLAHTGSTYRNEPSYRYSSGSTAMEIAFHFLDCRNRFRNLRFIITDESAVYGVLRVRYVDEF